VFATSWDDGLDDEQMAAVTHGDSPLVIVAGAGTGKTRTLTARVARLLETGVRPERILLLTFTRRAADDMLSRAASLAGHRELGRRLRGGTFHAIAHQFVCGWGEALGVAEGFSVLDPADAADVMDLLRDTAGLNNKDERMPRAATLVDVYSRCVNVRQQLADTVARDFPWCEPHVEKMATLFRAYIAHKRAHQQLDFDDLLLYWRAALIDERLAPMFADMFDHVLVDEYQDVNALQVDIVRHLRPDGRGLTVVGDDAQAIYGFRGSDAGHLHELAASLPAASIVRIERNYRSLPPVVEVANRVRPTTAALGLVLRATRDGGHRPSFVRCHDAAFEARAVVDRILARHEQGMRLRDQAVLARASHHTDLIELELTARRVPYRKYGGLRFVEAAHVKDFAAALRLLDNSADDVAWYRLLRLHDGIGPARAKELLATLPPRRPEAVLDWAETVAAAPPTARTALAATLTGLVTSRGLPGAGLRAQAVLEMIRPLVVAHYQAADARLADLERLAAAASQAADLSVWLAELTLDPPQATGDYAGAPHLDDDYVVISTAHSAKGLEWLVVHLAHLVDGAFPSDMALRSESGLEEERRLFYVAVTRARDELLMYAPLRMPYHRRGRDDRHGFGVASRFVDEAVLGAVTVEEVGPDRQPIGVGAGAVLRSPSRISAGVAAALDLGGLWGEGCTDGPQNRT
jgi:DNA helicase-2/ATP-dependent DNA helicase PcrA